MNKLVLGIPVYNGESTLAGTCHSIIIAVQYAIERMPLEAEIYIILNGCVDNSQSVAEDIARRYNPKPLIRTVVLPNPSKAGAINFISKLSSTFVGYVDDDISLDNNAIYESIRQFQNPDIWGIYVDSYPKSARPEIGFGDKLIYDAMTLRTRYGLLKYGQSVLIGRCFMARHEKMPRLPMGIVNEDQYIEYLLHSHIKKAENCFVYYEGVYSLRDYLLRDLRITAGRQQLRKWFSKSEIHKLESRHSKAIDLNKLAKLGIKPIILYCIYRLVYKLSKLYVMTYLLINPNPIWKRTMPNLSKSVKLEQ